MEKPRRRPPGRRPLTIDKLNLQLRNPHSVIAVLRTRPHDLLSLRMPGQGAGRIWDEVRRLAREQEVPVSVVKKGQKKGSGESMRGGTALAVVKERREVSLEELFSGGCGKERGRGIWLALEHVQDPQNVGAIFRSAAFFGVRGIVLTRDRSAPLSAAVYDVASGGVEYVPHTIRANLSQALEAAKSSGLWILGTSEHAPDELSAVSCDRPWLVLVGNEERGLRRLTQERCDRLCRIPPRGEVTSLNASVAAGILMASLTPSDTHPSHGESSPREDA